MGDNYIDVITYFQFFYLLLDQWSCVAVTIPAKQVLTPQEIPIASATSKVTYLQ